LEDAAKLDAERASEVVAWEQGLHDSGFWWAPVCIPEGRLAAEVDSDAPAKDQLDVLEGWLDRQKPQGAGDFPGTDFSGGKQDRTADAVEL
jgi:hypothetical protein